MNDSKNSTERCVLCLDEKRSPVHIQCGHSFCSGCLTIYKSYTQYPWSSKCPICRHAIKEGPVKRKHSEHNVVTRNSSITTAAQIQPIRGNQTHILEEFMSLAANYFDDSHEESDSNLDTNRLSNEQDLAQNSDSYYDEEQTDYNMDDSDEDELSFYSDVFESFDNNYYGEDHDNYENYENYDDYCEDYEYNFVDNDDYCEDHNFVDNDDYCEDYNFVDNDDSYEPPHSRRHIDFHYDSEEANSFTNDFDDRVAYGVGVAGGGGGAGAGAGGGGAFDIDWETVIASDIIIID